MAKPTPLVSSSESQALRDALGEAQAALGSEGDVQRLRAKLGELPPVTATTSGASGAVQATGLGAKAAALTATAVLMIAAALAYVQREPEAAAPARAPAPAAVSAIAVTPAPPEPAPPIVAPPVQVARVQSPPVAPKITQSKATPVPQAPAPAATAPKELELLMSAQDALDASPQRALGLLDQHARLYPSGNFALEREALAIDALRKLSRTSAAQARARAFVTRFPNAPGTKRLQSWLDESAAPDHKTEAQPLPTR